MDTSLGKGGSSRPELPRGQPSASGELSLLLPRSPVFQLGVSGVFSSFLSSLNFMFICSVLVTPEGRREGLGGWYLNRFVGEAEPEGGMPFHAGGPCGSEGRGSGWSRAQCLFCVGVRWLVCYHIGGLVRAIAFRSGSSGVSVFKHQLDDKFHAAAVGQWQSECALLGGLSGSYAKCLTFQEMFLVPQEGSGSLEDGDNCLFGPRARRTPHSSVPVALSWGWDSAVSSEG